MKELSIEGKATRYEQAIKVAKSKIKNDKDHVLYEDDVIEIFPELKESKDGNTDEKVRKALIKLVTNHASMDLFIEYDIHLDEAITWLEKQGEHANFRNKIQVGDKVTRNRDGVLVNLSQLDRVAKKNEKQGEQKFVDGTFVNVDDVREDFVQEVYRVLDADSTNDRANQIIDAFDNLPTVTIEKQGEQKPAELGENRSKELSLSLQIQAYLNTASDELYAKGKSLYSEKRLEDIHKCMLMWQKLHTAYFYQKTTEWSEEDEETLDYIIDYIKKQKSKDTIHTKRTEVLEGMIVWLKSLKHQKQFITDEELAQAKKEAYNDALNKIEYHSGEPTFDDGWSAAIWYLKKRNTIPQSQWKPSEEQITWLYRAADNASKDSRIKQVLNNLLSDLKKLREE